MKRYRLLICPECQAVEQPFDDRVLMCTGDVVPVREEDGVPFFAKHRSTKMVVRQMVDVKDVVETLRSTREWERPDDQALLEQVADWIEAGSDD